MLISIIIPVYNAEASLPDSLNSIAGQFDEEVEVVFVNDGSKDNSAGYISRFLHRSEFGGVLINKENEGVAATRNVGLDKAQGEYLVFLDADDRFCDGALTSIIEELKSRPDILGWDWLNEENGKVRSMRQADYHSPEDALRNMMGGTMKWNLWLFAVKRSLVTENGLHFISGADMGEDMMFMLKAFACAKNVKQIHKPLYSYNASNPTSVSNVMDERRRMEVCRNFDSGMDYLSESLYADLAISYKPHLQLYIKRPLLISTSVEDYETWYYWWPESNAYTGCNKDLPFRIRLLQVLASHKMYGMLKLYNVLVYGFVYKFFFR